MHRAQRAEVLAEEVKGLLYYCFTTALLLQGAEARLTEEVKGLEQELEVCRVRLKSQEELCIAAHHRAKQVVCVCVCACACACAYACVYVYMYVCMCVCVCIYIHIHIWRIPANSCTQSTVFGHAPMRQVSYAYG